MKSKKIFVLTVAVLSVLSFSVYGQYYSSYYYDYKLLNPALVGMKDKHVITTVYSGMPSAKYPNSLYYGTYETSLPSIKSGIGALGLYDEFGAFRIIRGGIFFSKQFAFNEHSGLRAGAQLTYRHQEIDYSFYKTLHPSDPPLIGANLQGITSSINLSLGLWYYSRIVNIGVGVNEKMMEGKPRSIWNVIVSREFSLGGSVKMTPSFVYFTDSDDHRFDINSIFEIKRWILIGASYSIDDGDDDLALSLGLNVKDWVQVIGHVYSSAHDDIRDRMGSKAEIMIRTNIPHRSKGKE